MKKELLERYSRQIIIKDIGALGQKKISSSKILIVGAGGLGCPVADLLSRAGVGEIGIVDNDKLIVHQSCNESISSLDQYQWDPNPNLMKEKPKHNYASHMADAIRYALYSFETNATTF